MEDDGEDEYEVENLGPAPPDIVYSMQHVEEMHQEWQETHQHERVELQLKMQSQMDTQTAKNRAQQNLGAAVWKPTEEVTPMEQSRLSTSAPALVPGCGLGMGTTFYNSTP